MAPGIDRSFAAESWPTIPHSLWQEAREEARSLVMPSDFRILASDADGTVLKAARENSEAAGVAEAISFQKQPVDQFRSSKKYGCIVCNPPYGERTGDVREVERIYRTMGEIYSRLDCWSLFTLIPHPRFEQLFGRKAQRKRKLYNGNILCNLYQYLGPLPPSHGKTKSVGFALCDVT
jgi:putative N6-adenine-specific DNA methylase